MRKVNKEAKRELDRLAALADANGGAVKLDGGSMMDLCVEKIGTARFGRHGEIVPLYSFAHYGELNGDAMRDPDVVLFRGPDLNWYPVSYRNDYLGKYDECSMFDYDGKGNFGWRPALARSIAVFVGTWAENMKRYTERKAA